MYFMSDPQALHVTRNVIPGKLGVDLHLHRVHIPLVYTVLIRYPAWFSGSWKTSNGNSNLLFWPSHNLCNSVVRDERTASETHGFPWEGPNSVEILGMKD